MAQWLGQYSGHTHSTKVKDLEDSLRLAVASYRSTDPDMDRRKRAKAIQRLVDRLHAARLKLIKARLSTA